MKIKVLVIEDKQALNKNIVDILRFENYDAMGSLNFEDSKGIFLKFMPDIVILDIMLPGGMGYDLIDFFRRKKDVHILMLTALDDTETKRTSYDKGADDYITKPFEIEDIIFKVGAIKRRIIADRNIFEVGDIIYNKKERIVMHTNNIELSDSLSSVFNALVENYIVDPDNPRVYEVDDIDKRSVQTIINRIRKKLIYIGSKKVGIKSVYGKGYILEIEDEQ